MKFNHILSRYILSYDLFLSIILTLVSINIFCWYGDNYLLLSLLDKLTDAGVTVFSVIFPLFFAAFTIIITSSDDDFAKFLKENNFYDEIINTFKFTLLLVFITFLYSILLYSTLKLLFNFLNMIYFYLVAFSYIFLLLYSLFAVFSSILDSIRYAERRGTYYLNNDK